MSAQWSAVPCQEVHNTRKEWMDSGGRFFASVKLMCNWDDRFRLLQDLYTSSNGTTRVTLSGYCPRAYPGGAATSSTATNSPDLTLVGVTSATISSWAERAEPRDVNNEVMDYCSSAFVDVQYGRRWNIEEEIEFDSHVITQSHRGFKWATKINAKDQRNVNELDVPVHTEYNAILTREFVGLTSVPTTETRPNFTELNRAVGHTNPEKYVSPQLGMTFEEGTLLMLEPTVKMSTDMQTLDADNSNNFSKQGYNVTVKFLYKAGAPTPPANGNAPAPLFATDKHTHNLFWRPRMNKVGLEFTGGWDRLLCPDEVTANPNDYKAFIPFTESPLVTQWLYDATLPIPV